MLTILNGILVICDENATEVVIPDDVKIIGENAFEGCTSLTSVVIPESVCEIMEGAFRGCRALKSVTLPERGITLG